MLENTADYGHFFIKQFVDDMDFVMMQILIDQFKRNVFIYF